MKEKEKVCSDKKLAMFQAVMELIEEDVDVNTMKVSDITARAGIGKGTAYEYFSSKEEMVAEAIIWSAKQEMEKIQGILLSKASLKEQILGVLDFIEKEMSSRRFNLQLLKLSGHSCEIRESLWQEFQKNQAVSSAMDKIFEILIRQGREEGLIHEGMKPIFIYMILISGFISYFMYLGKRDSGSCGEQVSETEMKAFLCRNMLMNLQEGEEK